MCVCGIESRLSDEDLMYVLKEQVLVHYMGWHEGEHGCICVCMLEEGELRRMLPMKVCTDSSDSLNKNRSYR